MTDRFYDDSQPQRYGGGVWGVGEGWGGVEPGERKRLIGEETN